MNYRCRKVEDLSLLLGVALTVDFLLRKDTAINDVRTNQD